MAVWSDIILSIFPVALLIFLMVKKNGMPAHKALPLVATILYFERLIFFNTDANLTNASVVKGLLTAFTPIAVIWGAVFLFKTMEKSKATDVIRAWLKSITTVRVGQLMIIGWSFSFLIEGASGFGTPAALAAPLLVSLGLDKEKAALFTLVMNTVPVIFGAVGMPTWFGLGTLGLTESQIQEVAYKSSIINSIHSLFIPVIALLFIVPLQEVANNIIFIYLSILSSVIPFLLLSFFNYEFPSLIGGFIGLGVTILLGRYNIGMFSHDVPIPNISNSSIYIKCSSFFNNQLNKLKSMNILRRNRRTGGIDDDDDDNDEKKEVSTIEVTNNNESEDKVDDIEMATDPKLPKDDDNEEKQIDVIKNNGDNEEIKLDYLTIIKSFFPLWGTIIILIITRVQEFKLRSLLQSTEITGDIRLGSLGMFKISPAIVIQLVNIFGTDKRWSHAVLFVPSILPFFIVSLLSFYIFRMSKESIKSTFMESFHQLRNPFFSLLGALVFVELLTVGGNRSCAMILGTNFGNLMGSSWKYVAFLLGALGAFFSGSNTVANLLFGPIQYSIAFDQGISLSKLLALQNSGGSMGNMVCINNIVAVSSVLGLSHKEGYVLKRSIVPLIVTAFISLICSTFI